MKTRIIHTKFWKDGKVRKLSKNARLLFIFILSCEEINIAGCFELLDDEIKLRTGLTNKELQNAKLELQKISRIRFMDGWIYVINASKYNNYRKSPKNEIAYQKELKLIPQEIQDSLMKDNIINSTTDTTMNNTIDSNHKSEIRNKKSKIKNKKNFSKKRVIKAFDMFWASYPRKVGKKKTKEIFLKKFTKFNNINDAGNLFNEIMNGLKLQDKSKQWEETKYIPHPSTWLNQERWNDQLNPDEL